MNKPAVSQAQPRLLNPGSDEAAAAGCTCPVLDNARGKSAGRPGEFWISGGCPLHAPHAEGARG
jgi:hypothetical protein